MAHTVVQRNTRREGNACTQGREGRREGGREGGGEEEREGEGGRGREREEERVES